MRQPVPLPTSITLDSGPRSGTASTMRCSRCTARGLALALFQPQGEGTRHPEGFTALAIEKRKARPMVTLLMSGGRGAEKASVFLLKSSACLLLCSSFSLIACCVAEDLTTALRLYGHPITCTYPVRQFLLQREQRSSVNAHEEIEPENATCTDKMHRVYLLQM